MPAGLEAVPPDGHPNSGAKLLRTSGLIRNASVEPPQKGIGRSFTDEGWWRSMWNPRKEGRKVFDEVNAPNRKISVPPKKQEW
jgi:hypothetical protein